MPSRRSRLWIISSSGLICSAAAGLATEKWALAGVDSFYFKAADAQLGLRLPSIDGPAVAAQPIAAPYAISPMTTSAPPARLFKDADIPAIDPWQKKLEAQGRRWEAQADAEIRREQREASMAEAQGAQAVKALEFDETSPAQAGGSSFRNQSDQPAGVT